MKTLPAHPIFSAPSVERFFKNFSAKGGEYVLLKGWEAFSALDDVDLMVSLRSLPLLEDVLHKSLRPQLYTCTQSLETEAGELSLHWHIGPLRIHRLVFMEEEDALGRIEWREGLAFPSSSLYCAVLLLSWFLAKGVSLPRVMTERKKTELFAAWNAVKKENFLGDVALLLEKRCPKALSEKILQKMEFADWDGLYDLAPVFRRDFAGKAWFWYALKERGALMVRKRGLGV